MKALHGMSVFVVTVCLLVTSFVDVPAEPARVGIGVRPGFSIDPNQFTIGVQALMGSVWKARFAPSVDMGFGDQQRITTFNFDVRTDIFSPPRSSAVFYAGAGPTISIIEPDGRESDTEIGASLVGGLRLPFGSRNYYNLESRYGVGDIPEFKLSLGVMVGFGSPRSERGGR